MRLTDKQLISIHDELNAFLDNLEGREIDFWNRRRSGARKCKPWMWELREFAERLKPILERRKYE